MSDEEVLAMSEPPEVADTSEPSNPEAEEVNAAGEGEQSEPEQAAEVNDEADGDNEENPSNEVPQESEDDSGTTTEGGEIDYKAVYEKLLKTPFKADGKEISITTPEEAIALMQKGVSYSKKMASLKPNLKIIKMLEKNGLLDEGKLSFYIDLEKKNPQAIRKLVKDSGVDLYDLDNEEEGEGVYTPNKYTVEDNELAFDEIIKELKDTPTFQRLANVLTKEWDASSRKVIEARPELLRLINSHMETGIYDVVQKEMERLEILGQLPSNVPRIELYRQVGDAIEARGGFAHLFPTQGEQGQQIPQAQSQSSMSQSQHIAQTNNKKRAIAPTRKFPTGASRQEEVNYLNLSDEDFLKLSNQF